MSSNLPYVHNLVSKGSQATWDELVREDPDDTP